MRGVGGLLALCLAAIPSGCAKVERELTLNADGSADLKLSFAYQEKAWEEFSKTLGEAVGPGDEPLGKIEPLVNEEAARANLEKLKAQGVELKSYKVGRADGWLNENLQAHCRDVSAAAAAARAVNSEDDYTLKRNPGGSWTLTWSGGKPPLPIDAVAGQQDRAETVKKFKGLRAATTLIVPGEITATNAHVRDGRKAQWVLDIEDRDFFDKAKALGEKGAAVTFKGEGLRLREVGLHRYIRSEQTLVLNADGSVDVTERKSMHEQFMKETVARLKADGTNPELLTREYDETFIRNEFKQDQQEGAKQGVELKKVKCGLAAGWHQATVELHCRDLVAAREALDVRDYALARSADGNYLLTIGAPRDPQQAMPELPAMKDMIRKMWEFQRLYVTVRVPGDVITSTAHETSGRELKWSYEVTDPKFDAKFADMQKRGLTVSFKGEGLDLQEVAPAPKRGLTPAFGYRDGGGRKKPKPETPAPEEPAPEKPKAP